MAQRMVKKTSDFATGKDGLGTLTKLSTQTARVDFQDDNTSYNLVIIPTGEQKNIPEYFQFAKLAVNAKISAKITLTEKNDGIAFISPANAELKVKFLWFSGAEETSPAPKAKPGTDKWGKPNKPTCGAVLEVVEGKWRGCRLYAHLLYLFGQDEQGVYITSGKNGEKLAEFMDAIGVDSGSLTPNENLLPEIQKLGQANAKEFTIFIEKGWVNRYMADEGAEEVWVEEETIDKDYPPTPEEGTPTVIHPALAE